MATLVLDEKSSRTLRAINFLQHGSHVEKLLYVDGSIFVRLGSLIDYLTDLENDDFGSWFGYGGGVSTGYFGSIWSPIVGNEGARGEFKALELGFLPAFLYGYGLIGLVIVIVLITKLVVSSRFLLTDCAILVLMMLNANLNTSLFWYVILCQMTSKHGGEVEQDKDDLDILKFT